MNDEDNLIDDLDDSNESSSPVTEDSSVNLDDDGENLINDLNNSNESSSPVTIDFSVRK